MSSFILKIIACITMFIDHIGYVIFDGPSYFNYIGRLAFPIFAFQISQGYIHTHNIKKYASRLLVFALVSQFPFMLFCSILSVNFALNVIFTLIFGLICIIICDRFNILLGIIATIILGILSNFLNCDYGFYGVIIVFLFYVFRNNKTLFVSSFLIATVIKYICLILNSNLDTAISSYFPYMLSTFSSIIFIVLYNKKKGPNTRYMLYLFYPLHMLGIYLFYLAS